MTTNGDDDFDDYASDDGKWHDDEYNDEPIGSCENCGTNLYEDDCYILKGDELCGQCYWFATGGHER